MSKRTAFEIQPSAPTFEIQPATSAHEIQPSTCPVEATGAPVETFYLFDSFDALVDGPDALIDRP
jgi:hypothetical protein